MSQEPPNKDILSIDFEDDQNDYDQFSKFLDEHTARQKNKAASEIEEMGDLLLSEIDHKKSKEDVSKKKLIKYITKKSDLYSAEFLMGFDYSDLQDMYDELKEKNRSIFKKLMEFFI